MPNEGSMLSAQVLRTLLALSTCMMPRHKHACRTGSLRKVWRRNSLLDTADVPSLKYIDQGTEFCCAVLLLRNGVVNGDAFNSGGVADRSLSSLPRQRNDKANSSYSTRDLPSVCTVCKYLCML